MQDAEDLFIEIHPHCEQYYINFKMSSFPNYNKNSLSNYLILQPEKQ